MVGEKRKKGREDRGRKKRRRRERVQIWWENVMRKAGGRRTEKRGEREKRSREAEG